MVGRIALYREKGRGGVRPERLGGLTLMTGELYVPPGLARWRLRRRIAGLERALTGLGIGRVVLPEGFPYQDRLARLHAVETLGFYRANADVLALAALRAAGVEPARAAVALHGPWLCPALTRAAQRLCAQVRTLRIDVPEAGERYARWLQGEYGLPVAPAGGRADVTVSFGPGGCGQGRVLRLYEPFRPGRLRLHAKGVDLPADCDQPLLALLWEEGAVKRDALYVRDGEREPAMPGMGTCIQAGPVV